MFPVLVAVILPLLLLACYHVSHLGRGHHRQSSAAPSEPPSPHKLPLIGNLHQLGPLLHRSLSDLSREKGPVMLLRFGCLPVLVVSSADAAQEVMKSHDVTFASRPSMSASREMVYNCTDVAFAPYGEYWRQARKLCTIHLLSAKRVQSYAAVRAEEVASMVEKIASRSSSSAPVNLSPILHSFANEVVTRVALGRKYHTQEGERDRNTFCEIVEEMSTLFGLSDHEAYFPWFRWLSAATPVRARMRRCFRRLDGFLERVVEEHMRGALDGRAKKESCGADLVDVLLSLQGDRNTAIPLTRDNLKAIILDMFAAGTDTSYIVIEWALAELVRHPETMEKVQGEVRGVVKTDSMVSENELNQMVYLDALIKEALRLHPPAPLLLPRESTSDVRIGSYEIPSKTRVLINAWAIGRDPDCWAEPEEFRPERFVGSPVDFRGQDFRYIPFGAGRRMCPGIAFAMSTVKLALANLLHRFDWKLPEGMCAEDLDMAEAPGLTTRKKCNLLLMALPRSS